MLVISVTSNVNDYSITSNYNEVRMPTFDKFITFLVIAAVICGVLIVGLSAHLIQTC